MEAVQKFDAKVISAKAILLDIEGTTTSKRFVKDTLFSYAAENVESYLTSNWEVEEVKSAVTALRELAAKDKIDAVEGCVEIIEEADGNRDSVIKSVVENVKWQISLDRKTSALKTLQGLIWEKGYKDGTIKGHVYDDVPEALASWVGSGHRLYVYSSGSVAAQKLLFGHTEKGSLLDNFVGYFDTSVGGKQEAESYKNITNEIGSDRILFLTDIVKEAAAAVAAGMSAVLVERDDDCGFTDEDKQKYAIIKSFADLPLSAAGGKRKSIDNTEEELPPAKVAKTDEITEAADSTEVTKETSNECTMETDEKKTEEVTEKVSEAIAVVEEAQTTQENKTEKPQESNAEAMEVDAATSEDKETPAKASDEPIVNEIPECDSTQIVEAAKTEEVVESPETPKEQTEVVKTETTECKMEEVTESKTEEVKSTENEATEVSEDSKTEETVTEAKIKENGTAAEQKVDVTKNEVTDGVAKVEENGTTDEIKVTSEETETSKSVDKANVDAEAEVTTTDAKVDQADNTLKESNGIESNGTNGTKAEEELAEPKKVEENGKGSEVVESSTNGTDSDKENDKEEDKKSEVVTNGTTNGVTEEASDVKIKKIQADSSPLPAQVEEASA